MRQDLLDLTSRLVAIVILIVTVLLALTLFFTVGLPPVLRDLRDPVHHPDGVREAGQLRRAHESVPLPAPLAEVTQRLVHLLVSQQLGHISMVTSRRRRRTSR